MIPQLNHPKRKIYPEVNPFLSADCNRHIERHNNCPKQETDILFEQTYPVGEEMLKRAIILAFNRASAAKKGLFTASAVIPISASIGNQCVIQESVTVRLGEANLFTEDKNRERTYLNKFKAMRHMRNAIMKDANIRTDKRNAPLGQNSG